jgi:hypothetical protein
MPKGVAQRCLAGLERPRASRAHIEIVVVEFKMSHPAPTVSAFVRDGLPALWEPVFVEPTAGLWSI